MRHSSRWLIGMTAGLVLLLSPAWALANRLEIPGNGSHDVGHRGDLRLEV